MQILLEIKDDKSDFIIELLSNFDYVRAEILTNGTHDNDAVVLSGGDIENEENITPQQRRKNTEEFLEGFRESLRELKAWKQGKVEYRPAREVLDEL
jgi:predicted RNA-binding protein with RPS1 domain